MRVLRYAQSDEFQRQLDDLRAGLQPENLLFESRSEWDAVQEIIRQVRSGGDRALCEFTRKFDTVELTAGELRVDPSQLSASYSALDGALRSALELAVANVRRYQEHLRKYQEQSLVEEGVELRTRYRALDRVGICVPGASSPLPSSLIMTAVPAQVAGVRELVVVSAPRYRGTVHPVIQAVCHMLGIDEVYRVSGAQAVAAMALGTESISRVDKIVGPGNVYVQLAKKLLFGIVDIDSFAGTTEIVVLADDTSNPRYVAADLIGQAEHDPGSAILVTPSSELVDNVLREIDDLLKRSSRAAATRRCLEKYSAVVVTNTLDEAIEVVNRLAPEHLSVQTDQPDRVSERCVYAGAIFIGEFTSEAVGDYVAGPSHVLPTGGTSRFFSPLNVMDFIRHTSVIKCDRRGLQRISGAIKSLAETEELPGHLLSTEVRLED